MSRIEVYDPPMGPTAADPALPRFEANLRWLKKQGVPVVRFNPGTNPAAFARCDVVRAVVEREGHSVLPIVVLDGRIVAKGAYPSREDLASLFSLVVEPRVDLPA